MNGKLKAPGGGKVWMLARREGLMWFREAVSADTEITIEGREEHSLTF